MRNVFNEFVKEDILCKKCGKGIYVIILERIEVICVGNSFINFCYCINVKLSIKIIFVLIKKVDK